MNTTYPYTILPDEFTFYKYGNPYPKEFKVKKPEILKDEDYQQVGCQRGFVKFLFLAAVTSGVMIVVILNTHNLSKDQGSIYWILFFIAVILFFFIGLSSYNSGKEKIEKRKEYIREQYQENFKKYEKSYTDYKSLKEIENDSLKDLEYRKAKILDFFKNIDPAETKHRSVRYPAAYPTND